MKYKLLFIFIEGDDDERFFQRIINPIYEKKYIAVKIIKYAKMKKEKIINFLKSIRSMRANYIFVTDINMSPCISYKKQNVTKRFDAFVNDDKIAVVIKEIESWYLAGISDNFLMKYKIPNYSATDTITKEQFNSYIPKKFDSRIDFMMEILKHFSIEIAKQKNKSFKYFLEKYNC